MNRVREFRNALNLSQNALGKLSGVCKVTISFIETNPAWHFRSSTARKIARALGRPFQEVFPDYIDLRTIRPKKAKGEKCRWCGGYARPDGHAALVVGGKVVLQYGHERCLRECIRTEEFG